MTLDLQGPLSEQQAARRLNVLVALPDHDFDTTEVSIPWHYLVTHGFAVSFTTERGAVGQTDPRLLSGVIFGQLGARPEAIAAYRSLQQDTAFQHPIPYAEIEPGRYDALLLPGGHAGGMRQYLESTALQGKVLEFWRRHAVIGAICHGPLVLARTFDPATGRSVLYGRTLTALTKRLERTAYFLTAWRLGRYYRTYPQYVEDEIVRALRSRADFQRGGSIRKPFVVVDDNLVTARYPGDAGAFARALAQTAGAMAAPATV